jgi:hypothetical protein
VAAHFVAEGAKAREWRPHLSQSGRQRPVLLPLH